MPTSKAAKNLRSLIQQGTEFARAATASADDAALKQYVSSIDASSRSTSKTVSKRAIESPSCKRLTDIATQSFNLNSASCFGESSKKLSREISAILCGDPDLHEEDSSHEKGTSEKSLEDILNVPWFSSISENHTSVRQKEVSRERKQKWVFKNTQTKRFDSLVRMCNEKLGADATIKLFDKLGRETGVKEYNAWIKLHLEYARSTDDEEASLQDIYKAYQLLKAMREKGLQIKDETYGPLLMYLVDFGMIEEFRFFCEFIREDNSDSLPRLAYYEMLLWVRVNRDDKLEELFYDLALNDNEDKCLYQENYLLALGESDRKKEFIQLLETLEIAKVSTIGHAVGIFKSLGKFSLVNHAEMFIRTLKTSDIWAKHLSSFIYNFAISMPNLSAEDLISKFRNLHSELEVIPAAFHYEELINHCCELKELHLALDVVDEMFDAGLALSLEAFRSILDACEESCEYNMDIP